jgi:adenine nucleotide transporter 17
VTLNVLFNCIKSSLFIEEQVAWVTTMLFSLFITFYALEVTRKSLTLLQKHGSHQQKQRSARQLQHFTNHLRFLDFVQSDVNASTESPKKPFREASLWEMMQHIAQDEGVLQLWHGTWSSLLLVSNPAIQYFLYEQIRVWVFGMKKG